MSRSDVYPPYVYQERRKPILGTLFKCIAVIAVVGITCGTGIVMGTLGMVNGRVGSVMRLVDHAMDDLPTVLRDAAPILADATKDRRDPEYVRSLEIDGSDAISNTDEDRGWSDSRAVVEIKNNGDKVVSVLALRVVSVNKAGEPIKDTTVYGATPLAIEDEWRGPLFPGSKRKVVVRCPAGTHKIETEVAELRIWDPTIEAPIKQTAEARREGSIRVRTRN